jgi:hypothetical protein
MHDTALVKLDAAQHALAECKTVMEAKQIADVAEAARVYLERTNASVETVHRAAEIRTLAENQMGKFLKTMPKNQGGDPVPHRNRVDEPPTLRDIGLTKKQSATAQKLADIPEPEFRERIAVLKASGDSPTPAKVLSLGRAPAKRERFVFPDRGMFIARGAVSQLEKILPNDGERRQALAYVRDWCNRQLNKDKTT